MRAVKKQVEHLFDALSINPRREIISLVGGGGKTSAMLRLAKELHHTGRKVIFTTTTHTEICDFDLIRIPGELSRDLSRRIESAMKTAPAFIAKRIVRGEKVKGLSLAQIAEVNREVSFEYMLIEADGAKKKPLKAPHRYEPAVPLCTTLFIPVIGYDSLGSKLNQDEIHRPQIVARIIGKPLNERITHDDVIRLLQDPRGLLKGRPDATRASVIINKVTAAKSRGAKELAARILAEVPKISSVICGEVNTPHQLLLFR